MVENESYKSVVKILHIGEYVKGGVATYIRTILAKESDYNIQSNFILSKNKSEQKWPIDENYIRYYKYERNVKYIIPAVLVIRKALIEIKPDIIYCHSTWAGVLGRLAKMISLVDAKIIYNAHGWSFLCEIATWKKILYASIEWILGIMTDRIINVSKFEYNEAIKWGMPKKKMCVISSGISARMDNVGNVNYDKDKINILFVGRFDRQKGVDFLINVFEMCTRNDLHLTLIGDNVVDEDFKIKGNSKKMTFLGWLNHEELGRYYNSCDAVIMPSRWEAFGLVAIEAMKYGKPLIVSDRGALIELVRNDDNGYVFNMDNEKSLLSVLDGLKKNELKKKSKKIKREFIEKYTDEKMMLNTYELYKEILAR